MGAILAQTVRRHGETFSTGTDNNLIRLLRAASGEQWFGNLLSSIDQNLHKELAVHGEITRLIPRGQSAQLQTCCMEALLQWQKACG